MAIVTTPVWFDNNELTTVVPGLTILGINSYLIPKRNLVVNDVARSDKSKISTGYYNSKDITISVGITNATRTAAEQSLDTLLLYLQGLEKDLVLNEGGAQRRYTATYSDYMIKTSGGSYVELDLIFTCSDRFGYSLQYEKLLDTTGRTLYNYTDAITLNGNAPWQVPVLTVFLSAITAATTNIVTLKNAATGRSISVNRAWTAGDRLIIDCQNRTVTVNGVAADFTGSFPEFAPGAGYLNYQDTFTSRTVAISAYYYRRFV